MDNSEMSRAIGRLESKLDCVQKTADETKEMVQGLEKRVGRIEIRASAFAAVVASGFSGIVSQVFGVGGGGGGV